MIASICELGWIFGHHQVHSAQEKTSWHSTQDTAVERSTTVKNAPQHDRSSKAIGFSDADLAQPIVGIANTWIGTMPCNFNLRALAEKVKQGVRAAGGTPMEFNTVAISDGITMGTEGMKASLVSREVIADSIELVGRGHMFDAVIALGGV